MRHRALIERGAIGELRRRTMEAQDFPWYYYPAANYDGACHLGLDPALRLYEDCPQMVHTLIRQGESNSAYTEPLLELIDLAGALGSVGVSGRIERLKANLLFSRCSETLTQPHTDFDGPAISVLVYVNDSDGDTVFFDRAVGDDLVGMSEALRVTPSAGDVVIFDSRQYHAASLPVETRARAVISCVLV